jgi:hypothetical protein
MEGTVKVSLKTLLDLRDSEVSYKERNGQLVKEVEALKKEVLLYQVALNNSFKNNNRTTEEPPFDTFCKKYNVMLQVGDVEDSIRLIKKS